MRLSLQLSMPSNLCSLMFGIAVGVLVHRVLVYWAAWCRLQGRVPIRSVLDYSLHLERVL
jgi:hypothetical protein